MSNPDIPLRSFSFLPSPSFQQTLQIEQWPLYPLACAVLFLANTHPQYISSSVMYAIHHDWKTNDIQFTHSCISCANYNTLSNTFFFMKAKTHIQYLSSYPFGLHKSLFAKNNGSFMLLIYKQAIYFLTYIIPSHLNLVNLNLVSIYQIISPKGYINFFFTYYPHNLLHKAASVFTDLHLSTD